MGLRELKTGVPAQMEEPRSAHCIKKFQCFCVAGVANPKRNGQNEQAKHLGRVYSAAYTGCEKGGKRTFPSKGGATGHRGPAPRPRKARLPSSSSCASQSR